MFPQPVTRRTVIKGAVAGLGAAAVAPATIGYAAPDDTTDAVVVGAGLSGLAAATALVAAGKTVRIVEALNRPGGRVLSAKTKQGYLVDGGAEFIGPTQDRIQHFVDLHNIKTEPTYNWGWSMYYDRPDKKPYLAKLGVPIDEGSGEALGGLLAIKEILKGINPGYPWDHPNAKELDSVSWEYWVRQHAKTDSAALQLDLIATTTLSVRPREVSALFVLNYIAAAGNAQKRGEVTRLVGVEGGAQERFFNGGAAQVPAAMAAALGSERIVYGAPTRKIRKNGDHYEVITDAGRFKGTKVVVAMSPAIMGRIDFEPGLPQAKTDLYSAFSMGRIGKFFAVYDEPWWRTKWMSGQTIGDGAPVDVTFESYGEGKHFLMGFISGDEMARLDDAPEEQVKDESLAMMSEYFGDEVRTKLTDWGLYRWDKQPFAWGGPTAILPPGHLTKNGYQLAKPFQGIHFAGTETSDFWTGYMDGAVRSGERAASDILAGY